MKSIFSDLSLVESDRAPTPSVLLNDDFTDTGLLDPVIPSSVPELVSAPAKAAKVEPEDPISVMRKIVMGNQVDQANERIAKLEQQLADMKSLMNQRLQELERSLRDDIARVSKAAADALQAQNDTLSHDIEQTQTTIMSGVDERVRKLSAASVPRTHLAEILRDLSSRLQPAAV